MALVACTCISLFTPALAASTIGGSGIYAGGIRPQDEIVLADVRSLCGVCSPESLARSVRFETYVERDRPGRRHWQPSDLGSFVAYDPAIKTVIFIHGNQVTSWDAKCQGLALYRRMVRYSASEEPIRFVIFSWPAAKVGRLLQDVRIKAARTAPAGCQLAWLIDQLPAETPISLVGFSFGARIATGAMHILAGGRLHGYSFHERLHPNRAPMNAVFIAAALHSHWLGKGQRHGLAMTHVDRMLLLNNCADPAMRYYRFIDRGRPRALGCAGPTCIGPAYASKIVIRDVSRSVGSRHDLYCYLSVRSAVAMMWDYTDPSAASLPALASK